MASVTFELGDQHFTVACRDGGEPRLRQAIAMIAKRWPDAARAAGSGGASRAMLFAALMLADALIDSAGAVPEGGVDDASLAWIADRLDALADALETSVPNA